jgi:S1-C subfamily serine protease
LTGWRDIAFDAAIPDATQQASPSAPPTRRRVRRRPDAACAADPTSRAPPTRSRVRRRVRRDAASNAAPRPSQIRAELYSGVAADKIFTIILARPPTLRYRAAMGSRRPLSRIARLLSVCLLAVVASCGHLATQEEKDVSFAPLADSLVGGVPLAKFLQQRTAFIFAGARLKMLPRDGDDLSVELTPAEPGGVLDVGSAAAISPDGYFLTAAHCSRLSPVCVLLPQAGGPVVVHARVVWIASQKSPIDLAVVKADALPEAWFPIRAWADLSAGQSVATAGANGLAGGKILKIADGPAPQYDEPAVKLVLHDCPLNHGDSGGPLATLAGEFVGIEILARGPLLVGRGEAIAMWPDADWLRKIVANDRGWHPGR